MNDKPITSEQDWPLRPWILAALLGLGGLLFYLASNNAADVPVRMALAVFAVAAPLAAAFTLEADRWRAPAIFSVGVGIVLAGLAFHVVRSGDAIADAEFAFASGVVAVLLAVPLYQSGFHRTRFATSTAEAHRHAWTDAITAGGALAFTGLSWLVLLLLASLFELLAIDVLARLMDEEWFGWTFSGVAFGAALGLLRNQTGVLGTMQHVVMLVLSLLAVPLAAGLLVFLAAMILSGPEVLWEATRSATPILLACAAGAFLIANAVVRDSDESASGPRIVRGAALVLALSILPLTVFAAISMGTRVAQHGLSPERLWALFAIAAAIACGVAYFVAVVRGWQGTWRERLRRANLHIAVLVCALALLLALPLFDFGGISARNQAARLASGAVSVEEFDFEALRWDFGEGGREVLARLTRSDNEAVAEAASEAMSLEQRPHAGLSGPEQWGSDRPPVDFRFADEELREYVGDYIRQNHWACATSCVALDLGADRRGLAHVALVSDGNVQDVYFRDDGVPLPPEPPVVQPSGSIGAGTHVEVRPWTGRQIYVDGKPVGQPFD